jgi:S-DNA-T family DNA segregation ATPase FtsK/SpoIIIE
MIYDMARKEKDEEVDEKDDTTPNSKSKNKKKRSFFGSVRDETVQGVYAIIALCIGVLLILAILGKAGVLGDFIYVWLSKLLGTGYILLPLASFALAVSFVRSLTRELNILRLICAGVLVLSVLGMIELAFTGRGGALGELVIYPFMRLLGLYATWIILLTITVASSLLLGNTHLPVGYVARKLKEMAQKKSESKIKIAEPEGVSLKNVPPDVKEKKIEVQPEKDAEPETEAETDHEPVISTPEDEGLVPDPKQKPIHMRRFQTPFSPPPLSLLERDKGKPEVGDIKASANVIRRTLQNFGINVEMDEVSIGPSVTRYALKPAEGVKLTKILALSNDLALALAAHPIRIEAPIPGKSLVGIEVPNTTKTMVGLGTLFSSPEFSSSEKPLLLTLGKGITGKSHFADLAKMPHLLVAGATGSGKSVSIHVMITSLLFRNSPENLRFIMIDPKRVELTLYNKIPHLLNPVITDPKKAILALKWAGKEMERRYNVLEQESVRDIHSYHKNVVEPALAKHNETKDPALVLPETMPYIVIVIDELADIMQTYPRELESSIVRLAQMSRAVGIHLILSTQRPSVNVITGLIKANIPARVALQVASQIDSRTILDGSGAEKLLGAGDMLYLGAEMSKPVRLQAPFISESEVKKTVKHIVDQYQDELISGVDFNEQAANPSIFEAVFANDSESDEDDDELYEEAREVIVSAGRASTSYLQRKLKVGYARAARLMDILEERGVIGPADGSKPRMVIGAEGMPKPDDESLSSS